MSTTTPTAAAAGSSRERTVLLVAGGFAALEGYDLASYGVTIPSLLGSDLGVTKDSAGHVGSLLAMGMLVGAALCAILIRRYGSRRLLFVGAGIFSVGTLGCALATTFDLFGVARTLVGLGIGIVLPTLTAYVADVSESHRRSRNVGAMMAGYAGGALLSAVLASALLPEQSWRWIYAIGALPAVVLLPLAVRLLPESPHTPATGAMSARNDFGGLGLLFGRGVWLATVLFWTISFCGLLLVFGISTWLPTIMQEAGYSLGSSLRQTSAMWFGAGVGMVAGGALAGRLGIKRVVVFSFSAGAVALFVMSSRPPLALLFVAMFVSGLGFIGSQVLTNAFIVTRYPDELRGPAIGWALSVGRVGAIVGPTMGSAILTSSLDVKWNFYLFAIPAVVGAVLAACVPVIRARRPVAAQAEPITSSPV
ncbi:MFS transporter [Nocardioides eburneiflavus]|uniref:MFS transporter n=1 Tax=Nocardioides eburneiflavus TaxID=2518372 RepID=A0A4Z1CML8_9ACTN|nr:MFS transporter [Nocardioides eburneiflavus]TGN65119.1 MFS transporter [Nocardioides eburneiflavus]